MTEFGNTLREAREAKGYSIGQLAELTRLTPQMIEGLEHENFASIAAPIYGRGFVKLYCEAVGLDPKEAIATFMEIFNGERDTPVRERTASAAPTPGLAAKSLDPIAPEPPPAPKGILAESAPAAPDFSLESEAVTPSPPPVERDDPWANATTLPEVENRPARRKLPAGSSRAPALPPYVWRIAALTAAALVILAGLVLGVCALYRATAPAKAPADETATVEPPAPSEGPDATDAPRARRTPQKIPSLYLY